MSWAAAMLASLVSTLERPSWWLLGLASFLVRGGLLVFILPIVILPTPAGLANLLYQPLVELVFGGPGQAFASTVAVIVASGAAWLIVGGLVAAWTDVTLVAAVAGSRRLGIGLGAWAGLAWRALAIRLASHVPLAIALSWGFAKVYEAAYAEYLRPGDLTTAYFLRIALRVPDVIGVITVAWLVGEAAGGLAVRHLVLDRASALPALARGWRDLVARPSSPATVAVAGAALLAVIVPMATAAGRSWDRLRGMLADGADPNQVLAALLVFAATWFAGIALVGMVAAWRSAAWTFEVARRTPIAERHGSAAEPV